MPFFKNVFRSKEGPRSSSKAAKYADHDAIPNQSKPRWEDAWSRKDVAPEEIQELVHVCTHELKSRAVDIPFLLLPFRPSADPSASRTFIRNFFKSAYEGTNLYTGEALARELRLTEPPVLCSIIKWCWSRMPSGVVTWDAYELFRIGESDSNFARHAFDTFIPLSVDSEARKQIIIDFFDLLAAVAARGKTNGMGGRKLSRMAGWWAFEHTDDGKGFDGGYRTWAKAADAASHLFFAYLRSLSPDPNVMGAISTLPRSLQSLLSQTEYPPQPPLLMHVTTTKVVMIVDAVSPTPFALLRRAKHFEYRDDDEALQQFSSYDDPVKALTDECRRVLECISRTNQSAAAGAEGDASWSRFEDLGFSGLLDTPISTSANGTSYSNSPREFSSLTSNQRSKNNDFGRPTTPSWADFLSSGFADENGQTSPPTLLLPPDKILPPIGEVSRVQSSQSHMRQGLQAENDLEPGELASITQFDLDETFWWVWMTSLAAEEPTGRKAVFGRCTLLETRISGAKWLVMEEQVKGASDGPEEGAYIAEKKGRFSFRTRLGRRKSLGKKPATLKEPYNRNAANAPASKTNIGPDQQARVQAAAARLAQEQRQEQESAQAAQRRARKDDTLSIKTNSVLTLQPHLLAEAAPAMKWDKKFGEAALDRDALRAQYLGDVTAGKGSRDNLLAAANGGTSSSRRDLTNRDLPSLPKEVSEPGRDATPSPAPPPATRAAASTAPLTSTMLDEKPVPDDQLDTHPALRKPVPERKPVAPPKEDHPEDSVPEAAKKSPPKKLKKHTGGGGGGFRKLFGKKKADPHAPAHEERAPSPFVPPADSGRYTPQPERNASVAHEPSPAYSAEPHPPLRAQSPDIEPSPAVSALSQPKTYSDVSNPAPSSPDVYAQREANQAFSRFDQGPMEDMPAFVPEDSSGEVTPLVSDFPHQPAQPESSHREDVVTPTSRQAAPRASDDVSEESVDLSRQMTPAQDRWAQIRKNAAERAARLSEEQTRRSRSHSARTDEGETSGEETIESRVARIKARVAMLTNNAEGQGPAMH
ncbi:uncharacterized protein EI97DRAFT_291834 [Westerdykella ornata]|uniref:Meiotically up-regulated protein Msb1/Mug8 domain-containing protein n=1 Tax=Westerdykella ornata TaxID=318751 RepID=A0A6A6JL91_WESOR|nr:uncharacterized protein EI97DRAFT_291834 [Westerdykella ornata]KAF2277430.1 hypothetical protein EI97DRAFT_291834 [Westerdykella ornata]